MRYWFRCPAIAIVGLLSCLSIAAAQDVTYGDLEARLADVEAQLAGSQAPACSDCDPYTPGFYSDVQFVFIQTNLMERGGAARKHV